LDISVKVLKDWRNQDLLMRRFGYSVSDYWLMISIYPYFWIITFCDNTLLSFH
jgi:hypothetical protein